jgi:CubicO group peptidase (beta-lactamase class C family)
MAAGVLLAGAPAALRSQTTVALTSKALAQFEEEVRAEMTEWGISGIAVALVDNQETVYAAGFGEARRASVFRCGSISKLFNAVAVMQLAEAGRLDLDAPVESYGHDLLPANPFTNCVTLRQLLCHRSGMIRESPVGGYLDLSQPGLAGTVESVSQCVLVNPPNSKTRYSNVGPSLAGRVVEILSGERFAQYQRQHVLGPLGMTNSAWLLKEVPRRQLAPYYMRVANGRGGFQRQRAPVFDLGTIPAGNLFTTAEDLARFVSMLAADGRAPGGRLLGAGSLAQMFRPQLVTEASGYGLGFAVGKFREHKTVSHNGAVYGCSSSLVFLPEPKLGVVVLGNEDVANARIGKLANAGLALLLETKLGEKATNAPKPLTLAAGELASYAGEYESQSYWAHLEVKAGRLEADISGQPTRLTPVGARRFLADSRIHEAVPMVFERDTTGRVTGFALGPQKFERVPPAPPSLPRAWQAYLGVYGPDIIPLVVSARHGHLYAMTENMVDYRLTPVNRHVFAMPPGLYADEYLVFLVDRNERPHGVNLANMILKRK